MSKEVLRKRPGLAINFRTEKRRDGSVAFAYTGPERTLPERPLTIDEIALLSSLDSPSALPQALREQVSDCDQVVARLVFDGIVEIQRDGGFVTGAAALTQPKDGGTEEGDGRSRISELAMHYALAIRHLPLHVMTGRLYSFNSLPRTVHRGNPEQHFASITGIDIQNPTPRLGGREWTLQPARGWLYFRRGAPFESRFKIYLCPQPQGISEVIPGFSEVLGRARGSVFKIAFPAASLRRADKIVAYFQSFEAIQQTLSGLARLGLNTPVQAVPFSGTVPGTQLFSWGVDPPNLPKQGASSWRSWVARQVAECAHLIPADTASAEAFGHLQTALQLRDIDPIHWVPRQQLISRKWRLEL